MLKRTPLFASHQKLGARLVEFGGWEMPVQYSSILDEHQNVRKAAGLFDISHMGEITVVGSNALDFLSHTLTNDPRKLAVGQGQYTLMCNEQGGTIDDLYLYRLGTDEYMMIVNASRIEPDFAWLQKQFAPVFQHDTALTNRSDEFGAIAVQGPTVVRFIDQCLSGSATAATSITKPSDLRRNQIGQLSFSALPVWIARTGYTGEDGFEIIAPAAMISNIWDRVLSVGEDFGIKPAGLGARDTLRTEMCYPLYGHELDEQTSPIEAGLGKFVSFDKPEFVGRSCLLKQKTEGTRKKCVAFTLTERAAPPRPHYPILDSLSQQPIGVVVSGTQSPSLNIGIGLGYVTPTHAQPNTRIQIEIRGNRVPAQVVTKPIFKKPI